MRSTSWATRAPPWRWSPRKDPQTGQPFSLGFDQIYLDPYTGDELARRMRGVISHGVTNLMQFIYRLHWGLALDKTGIWILGIAALLWTIDCFTSFYLTLPSRARRGSTASLRPEARPGPSGHAGSPPGWSRQTPRPTASTSICTGPVVCGCGACCWSSPGPAFT
jgi:hypothetical protein